MSRGRSSSSGSRGRSSSSRGRSSSFRSSSSSRSRSSSHSVIHNSVYYADGSSNHISPIEREKGAILGLFITSIFFFFIGFLCTYLYIDNCILANKYCETTGYVVKNEVGFEDYYYTTYTYTVNGTEYQSRSEVGWEFPENDPTALIYYLKSNPDIITDENPKDEGMISYLIVGLVIIAVSTGLLITAIKKHKNLAIKIKKEELANTPITCPYCRTVLSSNVDKCPNCGANNRKK